MFVHNDNGLVYSKTIQSNFGTRKAEVLNSLIMNIMAKANDTNDKLQTFRQLLLSSSVRKNRLLCSA